MEIACPHCHQKNRVPAERLSDGPRCGQCKKPLLAGVIEANSTLLSELIAQTSLPVLVDFWAPWCGPCRSFAPTFKAAAEKHQGHLIFAKVDTEAHPHAGQHHTIRSIPTLASFWKGQEVGRISGALPPAELDRLVSGLIRESKS